MARADDDIPHDRRRPSQDAVADPVTMAIIHGFEVVQIRHGNDIGGALLRELPDQSIEATPVAETRQCIRSHLLLGARSGPCKLEIPGRQLPRAALRLGYRTAHLLDFVARDRILHEPTRILVDMAAEQGVELAMGQIGPAEVTDIL